MNRLSVKSDTGRWHIANRVEQKRREQLPKKGDPKNREWTIDQVKAHDKEDDCWIVVDGMVYDVTRFLMKHPGGKRSLLGAAGKDATGLFQQVCGLEKITEQQENAMCVGKLVAAVANRSADKPKLLETANIKAVAPKL